MRLGGRRRYRLAPDRGGEGEMTHAQAQASNSMATLSKDNLSHLSASEAGAYHSHQMGFAYL